MQNFLGIDDLSREKIEAIFSIADRLKKGEEESSLKPNSTMALIFEKPSTRTRVSFEVAMAQLGGHAIYIDAKTSQMSRGETLADTARVLSGYVDFIAARLYKHSDLMELANNASVPVINALTDLEHPCQAVSDLYTIREEKGKLRGITLAFLGDIADNVANSLMLGAAKMGMKIALVGPKGYQPNPIYFNKAREYSEVYVYNDPSEGLSDADIVYTDTFVSMGQESEAEKRRKLFAPYQLNSELLSKAKENAKVMHCLPAHRGEEITDEVLDGPRSIVWQQSRNKLLLEKAILLYLSEK
ncbi:MAG: ornithine carbamoyltransferase [Candidatus Micrarchaeaceae archaeon]